MSTGGTDPEVTELLAELTQELRRLEREVSPEPRGRLPTRHELARFTSEVAIPALILLLQTQIRALELLRRTIRLAEGRDPTTQHQSVKNRAEQLGTATLSQLDSVLTELQSAIEGRPEDDRARGLLDDAKQLQEQIRSELEASNQTGTRETTDMSETASSQSASELSDYDSSAVAIDVEEELRSLKGALDDSPQSSDNGSEDNGSDGTDENSDTDTGQSDDDSPDTSDGTDDGDK